MMKKQSILLVIFVLAALGPALSFSLIDGDFNNGGGISSEIVLDSVPETLSAVAVNLGLSVKWASCNVGAESPEEYGGYFAWGEIEEKTNYDWSTYKWCDGSDDTMIKYCTSNSYGTVDNKTKLEPDDDIAHVMWGGSWRMPTRTELNELCRKCTWTWTTLNGVNGYEVTGPNGNSIFLPAAGCRIGKEVYSHGTNGTYWSASLIEGGSSYAYYLDFDDGDTVYNYDYRELGLTVRPVTK